MKRVLTLPLPTAVFGLTICMAGPLLTWPVGSKLNSDGES